MCDIDPVLGLCRKEEHQLGPDVNERFSATSAVTEENEVVLMLEALREGKARSYAQPYFHLRREVSHWCRHEDCRLGLGSGRDSEKVLMGM